MNVRHVALASALALSYPAAPADKFWRGELGFSSVLHDNFFQAPEDEPKFSVIEHVMAVKLAHDRRLTVGGITTLMNLERHVYNEFESGGRAAVGLNWERLEHRLESSLNYYWDRPSFDVGDVFDKASGLGVGARYSWRFVPEWQLGAEAEYGDESFERRPDNDNTAPSLGASIRYRGWDYGFSPELGLAWTERHTANPSSAYEELEYYLKVRALVAPAVYITARYRYRAREYLSDDMEASNFGRKDGRQELSLSAAVRLNPSTTLTIYYAFQDADSTRPTRVFKTNFLTLDLAFRM